MGNFNKLVADDFTGKGMVYPIVLEKGSAKISTGMDLIKSSIGIILGWSGEPTRFFLGEFNSRINELMEEPNDIVLQNILEVLIADGIRKWETRIEYISTEFSVISDVQMNMKINFLNKATQSEDSFVYPFYKEIIY